MTKIQSHQNQDWTLHKHETPSANTLLPPGELSSSSKPLSDAQVSLRHKQTHESNSYSTLELSGFLTKSPHVSHLFLKHHPVIFIEITPSWVISWNNAKFNVYTSSVLCDFTGTFYECVLVTLYLTTLSCLDCHHTCLWFSFQPPDGLISMLKMHLHLDVSQASRLKPVPNQTHCPFLQTCFFSCVFCKYDFCKV